MDYEEFWNDCMGRMRTANIRTFDSADASGNHTQSVRVFPEISGFGFFLTKGTKFCKLGLRQDGFVKESFFRFAVKQLQNNKAHISYSSGLSLRFCWPNPDETRNFKIFACEDIKNPRGQIEWFINHFPDFEQAVRPRMDEIRDQFGEGV
jgi:hypothetical protein